MTTCTHGQLVRQSPEAQCPICERDAEIARLTHERDLHVNLSERLKAALAMPGTGSYVEWARECREAIADRDRLAAENARLRELVDAVKDLKSTYRHKASGSVNAPAAWKRVRDVIRAIDICKEGKDGR